MPKRGRPRAADPRTEKLLVRLTPDEKRTIAANAAARGEPVSEFVRRRCMRAPRG